MGHAVNLCDINREEFLKIVEGGQLLTFEAQLDKLLFVPRSLGELRGEKFTRRSMEPDIAFSAVFLDGPKSISVLPKPPAVPGHDFAGR
jgi:hypothetical protein